MKSCDQSAMATGYAEYKMDQNEGALNVFPAYRFGPSSARVPRSTWLARWQEAGEAVGWVGASRHEMVALKTSPIWAALSRFGTPWAPFDFGSTRELEDVERDEAVALGLMKDDQVLKPAVKDFNDGLEASVKGLSPEMREILKTHFGDQISVDEESAKWNIERTAPGYEGQRSQQEYNAIQSRPALERDFETLRSAEWGAPVSDEILRDSQTREAVEVSAVVAGRKPLFHRILAMPATDLQKTVRAAALRHLRKLNAATQ